MFAIKTEMKSETYILITTADMPGRSSLANEKDRRYFLNRFVCVGEFVDG